MDSQDPKNPFRDPDTDEEAEVQPPPYTENNKDSHKPDPERTLKVTKPDELELSDTETLVDKEPRPHWRVKPNHKLGIASTMLPPKPAQPTFKLSPAHPHTCWSAVDFPSQPKGQEPKQCRLRELSTEEQNELAARDNERRRKERAAKKKEREEKLVAFKEKVKEFNDKLAKHIVG